tara:strand:- start:282 stop:1205 length:924 start_codon:yes stop_codon:yes gene_type:complete
MPTNLYFTKGTTNEQLLYEDLVIEALGIFGHDCYYLPRTLVNEDDLLGEDALSKYENAYPMEMWMETPEGYQGEKEIITRFGLEVRDETTFVVSRRRWEDILIAASGTGSSTALIDTEYLSDILGTGRPNEGDLIWHPTVKKLFIISFVDHDDPFYQIDNLPVYKLYCRTYEYSSQEINTGIPEIDNIEEEHTLVLRNWNLIGESPFTYNEAIRLEAGTDLTTTGLIIDETDSDNIICEDEVGVDSILYEDDEGDEYYIILENFNIEEQMPQADNDFFEDEAIGTESIDGIIDFSEKNPFGEPTEGM